MEGEWVRARLPLMFTPAQPTVHFAEDTLLSREDGESEEGHPEAPWPLPGGRQRLIRKDTPHYKKHFKISKLPQPEAVVALLQGMQPDGEVPTGPGGWHNGPHTPWAPRAQDEEEEEEEEEDRAEEEGEATTEEEDNEEAVASAPSVKVGFTCPAQAPSGHPDELWMCCDWWYCHLGPSRGSADTDLS
jgi:protein scribble